MTAIADIIARLRARAEAAGVRCEAAPPVSPAWLHAISREIGGLPGEVAQLLPVTAGLRFDRHAINFSAVSVSASPPPPASPWRLFPRRLDLGRGPDGACYLADLGRPHGPIAPVFGLWPDPPVLLLLAPSLADFLVDVARALPEKSEGSQWDFDPFSVSAKVDLQVARVYERDAQVYSGVILGRSADAVLASYGVHLPKRTLVCDMRPLQPGAGFAWAGRRRVVLFHRHPSELIFALTQARRWWRQRVVVTGSPSRGERRQWLKDFAERG